MPIFLARRGTDVFDSTDEPEAFVYMSNKEVRALQGFQELEALCVDGLHYHVNFDLKDDEVHIHYPFWNKKFDMTCPKEWMFDFYLAHRGTYSERQGIGPKNTFPGNVLSCVCTLRYIALIASYGREAEEAAKAKSKKKRKTVSSKENDDTQSPRKSKRNREKSISNSAIPDHVVSTLAKQWEPLQDVSFHSENASANGDDIESDITLTTRSSEDRPSTTLAETSAASLHLSFSADNIASMISRQMSKCDSVVQYQSNLQCVLSQIHSLTAMREKTQSDIDAIEKKRIAVERELHSKKCAHLASKQTTLYMKRVLDGIADTDTHPRSLLETTIGCEEKLMLQFAAAETLLRESLSECEKNLQEVQKAARALDTRISQITLQKEVLYQNQGIHVATIVSNVLTNEIRPQLLDHVNNLFKQLK